MLSWIFYPLINRPLVSAIEVTREYFNNPIRIEGQTPVVHTGKTFLIEHHIHGSSRLGVETKNILLSGEATEPLNDLYGNLIGDKRYELSNHLGNVLAAVSDGKDSGS